ncbi:hypothetical protein M9194_19750 [Vibrio sp. S4M6]|uniref:DUF7217 family protein n=1 Tax=Vibrio sinus TaxID=2946865 RepID=UPI00202AB965|nr:hypothetical protein [Vibrio sinus]MCL9783663.1 hypothetical protein [Vibrio sinus]
MSIDIYKAIMQGGGLNLSSPSITLGSDAIRDITSLQTSLDDPLLEPLVDSSVLSATKSTINTANISANSSLDHMTTTVNDSLILTSRSNAINKLDARVDGLPKGCDNTSNLFGSIQGEADEAFTQAQSKANELNKGIADFLEDKISSTELESMMTSASSSIGTAVASISSLTNGEQSLGMTLLDKLAAYSQSQTIETLWKDPCTQGVLQTVLPKNIKDLL